MKKICLISNLHLVSNPRVWKEANSLAAAGYEVVILTVWTSSEKREKDKTLIKHSNIKYKAAINCIKGEMPAWQRFYFRARRRCSLELKKWLKLDTSWILDFAPEKMLQAALTENADLYICHTEYGMMTGNELIRRGRKVAYDIEDWYSKDYLVPSRPVKLLEQLESFALKNGLYCTCPSQAMATGLENFHTPGKKVQVIYNGFSVNENPAIQVSARKEEKPTLIWFSQTIGPGRGLETLLASLEYVTTNIEVHLLGNCSSVYEEELKGKFPFSKGHNLFFHQPVLHSDLLNKLQQYQIGLALEQDFPESRNTTITNKILQYLQAGIKVLATATKGQQEVANEFPESVHTVSVHAARDWAVAIDKLIAVNPVSKEMQREKFNRLFSWEAQEKKLLALVNNAVNAIPVLN
jgi:glycosyltransferase involved in cell wall biosynthesis